MNYFAQIAVYDANHFIAVAFVNFGDQREGE